MGSSPSPVGGRGGTRPPFPVPAPSRRLVFSRLASEYRQDYNRAIKKSIRAAQSMGVVEQAAVGESVMIVGVPRR